jgi:hypothetical protein
MDFTAGRLLVRVIARRRSWGYRLLDRVTWLGDGLDGLLAPQSGGGQETDSRGGCWVNAGFLQNIALTLIINSRKILKNTAIIPAYWPVTQGELSTAPDNRSQQKLDQ